jgi:hypothetical protein
MKFCYPEIYQYYLHQPTKNKSHMAILTKSEKSTKDFK